MFGLTILGNNSAIPAFDRHPTAQVLTYEDQVFLIDCGEGTQSQLSRYKIRRSKIHHIFISHLHGDHYFGLIGLLTSMGLMGREHPLHIYGPPLLHDILMLQLDAAGAQLQFPLHFVPVTSAALLLKSPRFEVECFPVRHRIPCFGFLFREKKPPRKVMPEKALDAGIPPSFFPKLQQGFDYTDPAGNVIENGRVTQPNAPGRMYAYSADTLFDENLCAIVAGAQLLYHEATYLHEWKDRAAERYHTTARQAGIIARKAGVKRLLLGHFSSKYDSLDPFLLEAREEFAPSELALEGITYRVMHG